MSRAEGEEREGVKGGMQTRNVSQFLVIIAPACARASLSHLHGDPSVDAVSQTDAGWRLHLV